MPKIHASHEMYGLDPNASICKKCSLCTCCSGGELLEEECVGN